MKILNKLHPLSLLIHQVWVIHKTGILPIYQKWHRDLERLVLFTPLQLFWTLKNLVSISNFKILCTYFKKFLAMTFFLMWCFVLLDLLRIRKVSKKGKTERKRVRISLERNLLISFLNFTSSSLISTHSLCLLIMDLTIQKKRSSKLILGLLIKFMVSQIKLSHISALIYKNLRWRMKN